MTPSVTFIPPAQAEALYDVALDDQLRGKRPAILGVGRPVDEWDDGPTVDASDTDRKVAIHKPARLIRMMRK
jgi:hypothetical protein